MISILDLNLGNSKSLSYCMKYMGIKHKLISKSQEIEKSKLIIIPGVASFDYVMKIINQKQLSKSIIKHALIKKKPILGICIGMQIFFSSSEEGNMKGLGFFPYRLNKLKKYKEYKVPNVGFKKIVISKNQGIFDELDENTSFYFTNSYGVNYKKNYEFDNFCMTQHKINYLAGFQKQNIVGLQFHPELSHSSGMTLLKNIFNTLL